MERRLLERMCIAIEHRGPDSRGMFVEGGVGLGIQRLRVVDLQTGDQPIYNEDRSVVVVLNGEIYNFAELRADLRKRGHRFATQGDTEAIVHAYEEYGVDCVRHLHGMFAFALWDKRRHRLVIARDRVGKKPLFYSRGRERPELRLRAAGVATRTRRSRVRWTRAPSIASWPTATSPRPCRSSAPCRSFRQRTRW